MTPVRSTKSGGHPHLVERPPGVMLWTGSKAEVEAMLAFWRGEVSRLEALKTGNPQADWGLENHIRDLRSKISDLEGDKMIPDDRGRMGSGEGAGLPGMSQGESSAD